MKRRKFLGLGVLGLIGVKPLAASATKVPRTLFVADEFIDGTVKNPVHTLAEARELMRGLSKIGSPWPGGKMYGPQHIVFTQTQSEFAIWWIEQNGL